MMNLHRGPVTNAIVKTAQQDLQEVYIDMALASLSEEQRRQSPTVSHQARQHMLCDRCGKAIEPNDVIHGCGYCGQPVVTKRLVAVGVSESGQPFRVTTAGHRGWWQGDYADVRFAEDRDDHIGM